jgi:hypothetical protein
VLFLPVGNEGVGEALDCGFAEFVLVAAVLFGVITAT